jgi:hypothetical protein
VLHFDLITTARYFVIIVSYYSQRRMLILVWSVIFGLRRNRSRSTASFVFDSTTPDSCCLVTWSWSTRPRTTVCWKSERMPGFVSQLLHSLLGDASSSSSVSPSPPQETLRPWIPREFFWWFHESCLSEVVSGFLEFLIASPDHVWFFPDGYHNLFS